MTNRSEHLLERAWRRSQHDHVEPEGFLEDALAAALEIPDVWRMLQQDLGWNLPDRPPLVTTQDSVGEKRSDIRLTWSKEPVRTEVVLELKAWNPPTSDQLARYCEDGAVRVASISSVACRFSAKWFLGSITWAELRQIHWPDAPLQWKQLMALIDVMGVAVPPLDRRCFESLGLTLHAWGNIEGWVRAGTKHAAAVLTQASSVAWGTPTGNREMDRSWQRFAAWTWPGRWAQDSFSIYTGLFFGRPAGHGHPDRYCLIEGLPDLVVSTHLSPTSPRAETLAANSVYQQAVSRWLNRKGGPIREFCPSAHEFLAARVSSSILLDQADQRKAFLAFVDTCLMEWKEDGVLSCLAEVSAMKQT